jgi:Tol biopolymer transport system component/DNA-binding winged helix-turn-helix (wHTH) protein
MALAIKNLYEFGPFCLDPEERVLLKDGKHVQLTPKVFDTLLFLVQNQGRILSKDEMLNTIWQDSFVEESNLTFNIRKLRQALGDEKGSPTYIETIPKRGYRFKADVKEVLQESPIAPAPEIRLRSTNLKNEANINSEIFLNSLNDLAREDAQSSSSQIVQKQIAQQPGESASMPFLKTNKLLLAACLCLLVFAAGFIVWRYSKAVAEDKNTIDSGKNAQINYPNLKLERLSVSNTSYTTLSPDGKYLAYITKTSGRQSLWLRQIETNTNKEIIPLDDVNYYGIAFSNDSQQIYFARTKDKETGSIYRISILGGAQTELIKDEPQGHFAISPDDKQIAFIRHYVVKGNREYALFVADINGKNERKLITRRQPDLLWSPNWSPDGQRIICVAGNSHTAEPSEQIIEVRVSDDAENILLKPSWYHIGRVKPLKDGSGLLLVARTNPSSGSQLYFFDYKSKEISQVTNDTQYYTAFSVTDDAKKITLTQTTLISNVFIISNGSEEDTKQIASGFGRVAWMADNKIVFTSGMSDKGSVWSVNLDGGDAKQLSFSNDKCEQPAVSPDGRYIVFSSNRTGKNHIWRMDSNGNNPIQLTDGFGEQHPSISPDGKWVYYNSVDRFNVWKVPIEGGNTVKIADEYCRQPEVSPDGKMFACYQLNNLNKLQLAVFGVEDGKLIKAFDFVSAISNSADLRWTPDSRAVDYAVQTIGVDNIWRQPLDESHSPQQMTHFKSEFIFGFDWSPDRKQLVLTRGHWEDNIVLITGFR